ncbi:MAG: AraC family transcriptional regulator [Bryobacteraceae bacterium]|nr:AraC family transcriptional regulator [Bryobacteraceae bacterium]
MASEQLPAGGFYGVNRRQWRGEAAVLTEVRHREPRRLPRHTHERAFLTLLVAGSYRERLGSREIEFRPLTMSYRPAWLEHQDEIGAGGAHFLLVETAGSGREQEPRMLGPAAVRAAARLYAALPRRDPDELEVLLAELGGTLNSPEFAEAGRPAWLMRVEERLLSSIDGAPPLRLAASEAGVHPIHVARTFRRVHGLSMTQWVHRQRISRACDALSRDVDLARLSADLGFADQSHFTRVFRRETGITPAAMRRLLRS